MYQYLHVRSMDTLSGKQLFQNYSPLVDFFSILYKGDDFCDFQFVVLFFKWVYSEGKEFAPKNRSNYKGKKNNFNSSPYDSCGVL